MLFLEILLTKDPGMQSRWDLDRLDAGKVRHRKRKIMERMDSRLEGYRKGGIQERMDAGQEGCRKMTDAGQEDT